MNIRSIRSKIATIGSLFLLTIIFVSYQNFVTPTNNYDLDIISSFDPKLGVVIREADSRYTKYSEGLRNCTSRTAELELEHKTLKMNLLRVSTTPSQSFSSYASDLIVSESVSNQLKSVINRVGRKHVHMIGMYEPQGRSSAPVIVNVSGTGSSELILSSYERVNWIVRDPQNLIRKVFLSSYHPSQVSGLPPDRVENVDFVASSYDKSMAQFFLDEFMKRKNINGSCDDYLLASFQGSYSGSLSTPYNVLVSGPIVPTPPPALGTLQILIDGYPHTVLPGLPETVAAAQCQHYSANNPEKSLRCLWNTKILFERVFGPPKNGLFTVHEDGKMIITQMVPERLAQDVCRSKILNNPNHAFSCAWNGKIFFTHTPPPTPFPPRPPAPVYGKLQISIGNTVVRSVLSITRPDAESVCKGYVGMSSSLGFKCTWNDIQILVPKWGPSFPANPALPPVVVHPPPLPPPVPSKELGLLNFYLDSKLSFSKMTTEAEAYGSCKSRAVVNPKSIALCTWNGKRIF